MEYTYLGRSGLEVSRFALGSIPFGTGLDEKSADRIVGLYLDAGGNLVDTANIYGGGVIGRNEELAGTSERTVGKLIKGRRDRFVVATKGFWLMENRVSPNSVGLSRSYLTKNIENSLRRLGTDYVDLYQCHMRDHYTPVEETLSVLNDFVRAGKVRYVGVSNWDGWHVVEAQLIARQRGFAPIVSNQIWYNLADRVSEDAIIPACREYSVSIIAWGAMAEGFLSGKYRRGAVEPAPNAKMWVALKGEMFSWQRLAHERNWNVIDVLARVAERHGRSIPNIAIRWLLDDATADVILVGAGNLEQFENNLQALRFSLTPDEANELREVSEHSHPYPMSFYELFCYHNSKYYGGLR
jgi:aryl-alcohol dehydrogenase-like predicted oxidoreductase